MARTDYFQILKGSNAICNNDEIKETIQVDETQHFTLALHAQHALKTSHARYFYIFVCCSRLNSDSDLK